MISPSLTKLLILESNPQIIKLYVLKPTPHFHYFLSSFGPDFSSTILKNPLFCSRLQLLPGGRVPALRADPRGPEGRRGGPASGGPSEVSTRLRRIYLDDILIDRWIKNIITYITFSLLTLYQQKR